jgi:hypothetical protein
MEEAKMRAEAQKKELLTLIKNQYPTADIDTVDTDIKTIEELITAAVNKAAMAMKHGDVIAATEAFAIAEAAEAAATKAAEAVATKAAEAVATKAAEAVATKAAETVATKAATKTVATKAATKTAEATETI